MDKKSLFGIIALLIGFTLMVRETTLELLIGIILMGFGLYLILYDIK